MARTKVLPKSPARQLDLINVDEIKDGGDLREQLAAARALTRLVELVETARQDPDYVECVGDAELVAHLTWAAATVVHLALERYDQPHPRPALREVSAKKNGEKGA